jgi:hypothetical protein
VLSSGEREAIKIDSSVCWFQMVLLKTYAPGELVVAHPPPPPPSEEGKSQVPSDDDDDDDGGDDEMPTEPAEEVVPTPTS